jgi:ribosomal protein L11 methyltransferase
VNGKTWYAIDVTALSEAREAIEYGLMDGGATGTEANESDSAKVIVSGYFETPPDVQAIREAVSDALRIYDFAPSLVKGLNLREFADRDWLAEWKKHWRPVEVGRFVIAPPWIESAGPAPADGLSTDRIVVRINPGMAFGTGTHETTRLCLKALEKHFHGGSFLDVGTGTGILAIAAAKLFTDARIQAFDTDTEAIEIARGNARLNEVSERITIVAGTVDEQTPSADLVCANLTAPVISNLLPLLLGVTCGHLILSGILDSQLELLESNLSKLGVHDFEVDQDDEWIALVV